VALRTTLSRSHQAAEHGLIQDRPAAVRYPELIAQGICDNRWLCRHEFIQERSQEIVRIALMTSLEIHCQSNTLVLIREADYTCRTGEARSGKLLPETPTPHLRSHRTTLHETSAAQDLGLFRHATSEATRRTPSALRRVRGQSIRQRLNPKQQLQNSIHKTSVFQVRQPSEELLVVKVIQIHAAFFLRHTVCQQRQICRQRSHPIHIPLTTRGCSPQCRQGFIERKPPRRSGRPGHRNICATARSVALVLSNTTLDTHGPGTRVRLR